MAEWFADKPQVRLRNFKGKGSPLQYCVYRGLWDWAFDLGGLPDDPRKVAALTELDLTLINEVWAIFKADCVVQENGRLMPLPIVDADNKIAATSQKRRDAGKAGGHQSGASRRSKSTPTTPCDQPHDADDTPFNTVNTTPNTPNNGHAPADADYRSIANPDCNEPDGSLATALEKLFPGITSPAQFLELGQYVVKVKGCAADVRRWREWFRIRYHKRAVTAWTFKETLHEMITENKSLSPGARFIVALCFNRKSTVLDDLTQEQINLAITQGRQLDAIVKLEKLDDWAERGILPTPFYEWWSRTFNTTARPQPDSVVKYMETFIEAL